MPPPRSSPELVELFETYTANPRSIGAQLMAATCRRHQNDPLLVATGADFILFPGSGRAPEVESFRLSTRGFKELAGVSHLAPAVATIVQLHLLEPSSAQWRIEAERLLAATRRSRAANSETLWRDVIAVEAYRGREAAIAVLIDHACARTIRFLEQALAGKVVLDPATLRTRFLEEPGDDRVSFSAIMIATFFLVGMDIAHRVTAWLQRAGIDWSRAMVLITGKQGRPTAGVTYSSNSICAMIVGASGNRLPFDRIYIAPHAPAVTLQPPVDPGATEALEQPMRELWAYTRAIGELGPLMFDGYPAYAASATPAPEISASTTSLAEMPRITGPNDWLAMTARLRLVMEDPRQLLSGCVTDYAVEQLARLGNDPVKVTVPGLDGFVYPRLA